MENNYSRQPLNTNQDVIHVSDNAALAALAQRQQEIERAKALLREEENKLAMDVQNTFRIGLEKQIQAGEVAQ